MHDPTTLGEKIEFFRKRAGLTQLELEIKINASQGVISRIESNKINPTKETIHNISKALKLTNWEIEYMIGNTRQKATIEEIKEAREYIRKYFNKKTTFAYMTDERSRLIAVSKGFKLFANINDEQEKKLLYKLFPLMLLRDEFGIKEFIDPGKYENIIKMAFARTYTEMGFMIKDPYLGQIECEINKIPFLKETWNSFKQDKRNLPIRTLDSQVVYLKYKKIKFKLIYHSEILPINQRFCILDYRPNNILLSIIKKIL